MKEIKAIVDAYTTIDFNKNRAALATVVRVEGSSYRRTGARMLVKDDGTYLGGISGGCLEGDALKRCRMAIEANEPSIITYDTTQDDGYQIGAGLGCNGVIDVLFTPLSESDEKNPVRQLSTLTGIRESRIFITVTAQENCSVSQGTSFLFVDDQHFKNEFPDKDFTTEILQAIHDVSESQVSLSSIHTKGIKELKLFVEVIQPVIHLVVFGGNYDVYPLMRIAKELGWKISLITNTSKADKTMYNTATEVYSSKGVAMPDLDDRTAAILMTHDFRSDKLHLQELLNSKLGYIGMLGPRKRAEKIFSELAEAGIPISEMESKRIFAPCGLDIGANTPEEIALSIVAEIKAHFAGRSGSALRLRETPIHSE
ncbi:MAG: XshC-Cox1 family protein [Bacteroidetes bacterium]|nr:MAG: XshC-Cox1 family protein [Bacteroidota bacterium]